MEKTTNYQLPKWEKSDFIKMDDFNEAFGKLDAALKANADAAATKAEAETVTAIAQTIANGKLCRIKYGSYTGNGKNGSANPTAVNCDFYPVLFGIWDGGNSIQFVMRGNNSLYNSIGQSSTLSWKDNGLNWYCDRAEYGYQPSNIQYNAANSKYYYIVFGYDQ